MTDLAEINGAVATAQNKPDAQIADELTATEVQVSRLAQTSSKACTADTPAAIPPA